MDVDLSMNLISTTNTVRNPAILNARSLLSVPEGPVVRTAPNELSFNTSQSWKDIYDFRPGHQTFIKSNFYDGGSFADRCGSIVSERDPGIHGTMRKYLSHAFSQRSLAEQEDLISKSVDKFVEKLGMVGQGRTDIVLAFTLMSFDIIGDLGFGESFQGIESGWCHAEPPSRLRAKDEAEQVHPWIHQMTGALMQGAIADTFFRFPLLAKVALRFFSRQFNRIVADTKINEQYSIDLVKK